jgi:hypothetical protein
MDNVKWIALELVIEHSQALSAPPASLSRLRHGRGGTLVAIIGLAGG